MLKSASTMEKNMVLPDNPVRKVLYMKISFHVEITLGNEGNKCQKEKRVSDNVSSEAAVPHTTKAASRLRKTETSRLSLDVTINMQCRHPASYALHSPLPLHNSVKSNWNRAMYLQYVHNIYHSLTPETRENGLLRSAVTNLSD